jgi:hypothetical protein
MSSSKNIQKGKSGEGKKSKKKTETVVTETIAQLPEPIKSEPKVETKIEVKNYHPGIEEGMKINAKRLDEITQKSKVLEDKKNILSELIDKWLAEKGTQV